MNSQKKMNLNTLKPITILVVGATGLIGNTMFKYLSENSNFSVFGTIREKSGKNFFAIPCSKIIYTTSSVRL